MKNHILLFIFLFLFYQPSFAGTKQMKNKPPTASNLTKREPKKISFAEFDADPFGYEISAISLSVKLGSKFKVIKEIVANTHNHSLKDTIFHLCYQTTKIKVYKSQYNEFIFSAQIMDNQVKMRNDINIGMSKEEFWQKFDDLEKYKLQQGEIQIIGDDDNSSYILDLAPNIIKISNMMSTVDYSFAFVDNRLAQVNMNVYMD
jgi:hypothetical protein